MAQLAEISLALWREIEEASGGKKKILYPQPLLFHGSSKSDRTPEGKLSEMANTMNKLGIPFQELNRDGLLRHFPVFKTIPGDYFGYVQPNSAAIRVRNSMALFQTLSSREGAVLLENQPATVRLSSRSGYEVTCPAGTYHGSHLILCPGPWANEVLGPLSRHLDVTIWQMTVAYFKADTARYQYPLWYEFGPTQEELFYGFPPDEFPGEIKVSMDFTKDKYCSPGECTYRPNAEILKRIQDFLRQRFKGVKTTPRRVSTCLYTMSPDGERVLGLLPGYQNVSIFTGDSGRGFKFTPLFGRILVELATTGRTSTTSSPSHPNVPTPRAKRCSGRLRRRRRRRASLPEAYQPK
jgi:glycine/D-amino acid oxidase-like deaminating enzyme